MEMLSQYGDYTIIFKTHEKLFMAKNADGDVIRDGFSDIDKLTESLDNLDKRAEKGKKKAVRIAVLRASDSGYCKPVVATSIAPTGWRGGLDVWIVDGGSRKKENAAAMLLDTPKNRAALKQLEASFNEEQKSEKNREKIFAGLTHVTTECF